MGRQGLFLVVALFSVIPLAAADKPDTKDPAAKNPGASRNPHFKASEIEAVAQTAAGGSEATRREGEDWPEFLGPRQTGVSGETGLLEKWPATGPKVLWKKQIGEGYSAPSVRENRLVVFHRVGDEEVVECFTADTGEPLWKHSYPTSFIDPFGYNGGPRCTPLLTADHCYTYGAEGMLTCLKLDTGKEVWQRNTLADFKVPKAFFGVGSTPILEGKLLIVAVGGHPNSGVVAFESETGETVWESVGPSTIPEPGFRYQRDRAPIKLASYATPLVRTIHGKRHLLCFLRPGLVSLDPANGNVRFARWFRSTSFESVNAARPLVVDDTIFLSAAYETGALFLQVDSEGSSAKNVWQDIDAMQNHWSTSIHHGGYLYGFSGRHEPQSNFRCIERATGKLQWRTRDINEDDEPDPMAGLGKTVPKFYGRGSAILADGNMIVMGERGTLALVELNPTKFHEISRVNYPEFGYPCWTAPVLSRKRLYVTGSVEKPRRYFKYHLMCLDLAK
jgi:outer membrane protein assembly factor BamB